MATLVCSTCDTEFDRHPAAVGEICLECGMGVLEEPEKVIGRIVNLPEYGDLVMVYRRCGCRIWELAMTYGQGRCYFCNQPMSDFVTHADWYAYRVNMGDPVGSILDKQQAKNDDVERLALLSYNEKVSG